MSLLFDKLKRFALTIDRISEYSGRAVSWLVLSTVLIICYDVLMRYLFKHGSVAIQELEWHLFAIVFLIGGSYTFKHDEHVRVDILFRSKRLSNTHRAWINIIGAGLFLIPFCVTIVIVSEPFVVDSFRYSEGSPDPGGLPYRYLLKAAIPLSFAMLALQGLASIIHNLNSVVEERHKKDN